MVRKSTGGDDDQIHGYGDCLVVTITFALPYLTSSVRFLPRRQLILLCAKMDRNCHYRRLDRSCLLPMPSPNLSALVSDETERIWVSSQGWKPAVSSVYYEFYNYDKFQLRFEIQPKIET